MKKFLILFLTCIALVTKGAGTNTETQYYIKVIRENIFKDYKGMFRPAEGALKHPYIVPGCTSYQNQLWDWDSWLTDIALRPILAENGSKKDKQEELQY